MKKLISAVALATTINSAHAMAITPHVGVPRPHTEHAYNVGYRHGKSDAYKHFATTAVVVGFIAAVGIIAYKANEESRWGVNQDGIVYRF